MTSKPLLASAAAIFAPSLPAPMIPIRSIIDILESLQISSGIAPASNNFQYYLEAWPPRYYSSCTKPREIWFQCGLGANPSYPLYATRSIGKTHQNLQKPRLLFVLLRGLILCSEVLIAF